MRAKHFYGLYYVVFKNFQTGGSILDNVDEKYEFSRLKQSMEMVGFTAEKQRRLFSVLSAVLLIGTLQPINTEIKVNDLTLLSTSILFLHLY